MSLAQRNKQREMDGYKSKTNEDLLQELDTIEDGMMQEAVILYSNKDILASFALRYGLIKNEISQRIAYGNW